MASRAQTVTVDGRRLRLTNPDKVLYPATGTTKAEVLQYLLQVAPVMLPYLADRLCTRKRWPEGVGTASRPGEVFFEKNLPDHAPDWIRAVRVEHTHRAPRYPVIESVADLAWCGQMNALELHVPQWRVDSNGIAQNPDKLVLDLDPGPGAGLAECAVVAHEARALLSDIGLDTFPVTSGSKGLHLYAPLDGEHDADYVNAFAKQIAQGLASQLPKLVVTSMTKSIRANKVLVDWSQNNANKTTICPYSLRGTEHPFVAAPRAWEEINADLAQLDFADVRDRLESDLPGEHPKAEPARPAVSYAHRKSPDSTFPRAARRDRTDVMLASMAPATSDLDPADWSFEMKWDGIRALAIVDDGAVTLLTRNGNDVTGSYPEVAAGLVDLRLGSAVLDGELVALDDQDRPDFGLLQQRMGVTGAGDVRAVSNRIAVTYFAFDLLEHDGLSTRAMPWQARRDALEYLDISDAPGRSIRVPPLFTGTLEEAVQASVRAELEGVVAKRRSSQYRAGRSKSWLKFKNTATVDAIVVGWSPGSGDRRKSIGSLLLAVHRDGALSYAGRVGSGFSDADLGTIRQRLTPLVRATAPVPEVPAAIAKTAQWVEPALVVEVAFAGWTHSGHVRHARWLRWRDDKPLSDVVVTKS